MMRGIVLHFLILFSVLCAGLHAPAAAHGDHDDHGQASVLVADTHHADAHEDFSDDSSSDTSQELYHHHHCPMTTVFVCSDSSILAFASKELLWPSKAAGLGSLMPAPPIEPPTT